MPEWICKACGAEIDFNGREWVCTDCPERYAYLGRCCSCEQDGPHVRNMLAIPLKGVEPGSGWGCYVCGLPDDGAIAVLCDTCLETGSEIYFAVVGYANENRRVPIQELTEPFEHDISQHPDADIANLKNDQPTKVYILLSRPNIPTLGFVGISSFQYETVLADFEAVNDYIDRVFWPRGEWVWIPQDTKLHREVGDQFYTQMVCTHGRYGPTTMGFYLLALEPKTLEYLSEMVPPNPFRKIWIED